MIKDSQTSQTKEEIKDQMASLIALMFAVSNMDLELDTYQDAESATPIVHGFDYHATSIPLPQVVFTNPNIPAGNDTDIYGEILSLNDMDIYSEILSLEDSDPSFIPKA